MNEDRHKRTAVFPDSAFGPHGSDPGPDCYGTLCPDCGCCMHCATCDPDCDCSDYMCSCAI